MYTNESMYALVYIITQQIYVYIYTRKYTHDRYMYTVCMYVRFLRKYVYLYV